MTRWARKISEEQALTKALEAAKIWLNQNIKKAFMVEIREENGLRYKHR